MEILYCKQMLRGSVSIRINYVQRREIVELISTCCTNTNNQDLNYISARKENVSVKRINTSRIVISNKLFSYLDINDKLLNKL